MKKSKKIITKQELNNCNRIIKLLKSYYSKRVIGKEKLFESLLIALMANGHILLESVPGLAKTTAAKVLTDAVDGKFSRIQCTPDLLPSDIIGTQIFNYKTNSFETKIGPIYANFVLLDEINRSSSKTQSATLEAMQERQITIDGTNYPLPDIFIVIATQNPIEQEGTFQMSEAQLDRFLIKEVITYPTKEEELEILNNIESNIFKENNSILTLEDLKTLQSTTEKVYIDTSVKEYIIEIVNATRYPSKYIDKTKAKYIEYASSPRGAIAFMQCSKARALINGRDYVTPDDIKDLKYSILRHRITLNYTAFTENINVEDIIDEIFKEVPTP